MSKEHIESNMYNAPGYDVHFTFGIFHISQEFVALEIVKRLVFQHGIIIHVFLQSTFLGLSENGALTNVPRQWVWVSRKAIFYMLGDPVDREEEHALFNCVASLEPSNSGDELAKSPQRF